MITLDEAIEALVAIRLRVGRGDLPVTVWGDAGPFPMESPAHPITVRDDGLAGVAGIPTPIRRVVIGRNR